MMEDLKRVRTADVYKAGRVAGTLAKDAQGGVTFAYAASYQGEPVATTLPLSTSPVHVSNGGLPSFFAGLLPEGHRLTVLRRAVKTSADDELSLLLAIGSDVPGDVQVVPAGVSPVSQKPLVYGPLEEQDFSILTDSVDGVGLPGVQTKASASMVNTPVRLDGFHGILKVDPPEHANLVLNEAFHLRHAHKLRIPVAEHELVRDKNSLPGLLVKRFDRGANGHRFPLEDAAQILNIVPARKYNVDSEDVVRAVQQVVTAPLVATRNLFIQFFYAWLTGNGDLHAKNISVLRDRAGVWGVAPMYDVPSTVFYRDMTLALPIAGKTKNVRARHWEEFAATIGLSPAAMRSAVKTVLAVIAGMDTSELPFEGSILYGAQRELRFRRAEAEKLLE
ncbi:capsule biosynthesis enzymes-like protein [Corynebacterium falsenii DSM 44353]|uniref:type II toxin-antitoxin system HipA family toxin n=1 Tax=Corynebacterium falsenii TaxID=108486 RepID=UPI0003E9563F|nr:HipA domain-containing protein [Corynebacterium falsenii]AHI03598.1 capsule biosynthesis enzymes-like protein [Corynebacterium falsenii DSM 44353]UBI04320.1 HipA domain-containing protein [Corynebacterium falsenii]